MGDQDCLGKQDPRLQVKFETGSVMKAQQAQDLKHLFGAIS
jgi:hypothetical protein